MATDKTIVFITGANAGIGFSTAATFASSPNYHVILGARSSTYGEEALQTLKDRKPPGSLELQLINLTDDDSITSAANTISSKHGHVDILINNAGAYSQASTYAQRLRDDINVNAIGTALVTEAFIPLVQASSKNRMIINVSSIMGSITSRRDPSHFTHKGEVHEYRTSKAALNMITVNDWYRLQDKDIKIGAVCPGYVQSNLSGRSEAAHEQREQNGALSPETSAKLILDVAEGRRDDAWGGFINEAGTISW